MDDQWYEIGAGPVVQVACRAGRRSPGDLVEVWTLEEVEAAGPLPPHRSVRVFGTGHELPADVYHVGTAVVPTFALVPSMLRGGHEHIESRIGLVWHVFGRRIPV